MPAKNVEATINVKLGELLRNRHPRWNHNTVHAEQTGTLRDHPGQRVDILVENPGGLPVAIETEFSAGPRLQREAEARLGKQLAATGETIEGSLSVVLPEEMRTGDPAEVEVSELRFATHQLTEGERAVRWPEDGNEWLRGGIDRVADAIEHVSLSERRIAEGRRVLETCIHDGASLINRKAGKGAINNIAAKLHQEQGEQTTRMATAILVNAFVFHDALEGEPGIPDRSGWTMDGTLRVNVLNAWRQILRINYWPIFDIASKLLGHVPARVATQLLEGLIHTADRLAGIGTGTFHDLSGRMFQTLISDRKFLATFYTLPASACLLAELAVERLRINWADPEAVRRLETADFACGTGALITAAQRAIGRRHRRAGGDDKTLHSAMMERTWVATDIMPAAAHLTASMLSSAHPGARYGSTRVYTMPYGDGEGLAGQIGALELMHENRRLSLFGTGAKQVEGTRERDARDIRVLRDSLDLVIMNPPFTRPTNHEKTEVPRPSFAGLATSEAEQKMMSRRLGRMRGEFGHGNAGLASNFMDLAHNKLKPGGILALVLPFAFVAGRSWDKARTALANHYESITVTSVAAHGSHDRSFSADTGMAECLVVATKAERGATAQERVRYTSLRHRPGSLLEGHEEAHRIATTDDASALIGTIRDGGLAGIREPAVARAMRGLMQGALTLPRSTEVLTIAITKMTNVAQRGLVHRDINGTERDGKPRGPFDINPLTSEAPEWPCLWAHDANRERMLVVSPDRQAKVRTGCEDAAVTTWRTATRLHHNLDFRLNSQSLAACVTPEPSLGGRAWPNLLPGDDRHTWPLLLWANTTLGLMMFWWKASRQQQGRAVLTITSIPELPTLDPRTLSDSQVARCMEIYETLKSESFLPANEAYQDPVRKRLDQAIWLEVLGLPEAELAGLDLVRRQWCSEPSVHGGKTTRP